MLKLNAPDEIHWRRSNMNKRDPILMKSVEVLKDCRSLNAADEMNCPMPRSVEKVPVRNKKRCTCGTYLSCGIPVGLSVPDFVYCGILTGISVSDFGSCGIPLGLVSDFHCGIC